MAFFFSLWPTLMHLAFADTVSLRIDASSSSGQFVARVLDRNRASVWYSGVDSERQWLRLDLHARRALGGLVIDWAAGHYAKAYCIQISDDGLAWQTLRRITHGSGARSYIYIPATEARYVQLQLESSNRGQGYGIAEIEIQPPSFSSSLNQFFQSISRDQPRGAYPRYFYSEQSYWTVVGNEGEKRESLLDEDGRFEIDQQQPSLEPFVYINGELITWADVRRTTMLADGYLPIPTVIWRHSSFRLEITAFPDSDNQDSDTHIRYRITNTSRTLNRSLNLYIALRPFQVNPPWQNLNVSGGVSEVYKLGYRSGHLRINEHGSVLMRPLPHRFGATNFDSGSIVDYLRKRQLPANQEVYDEFGFASGAAAYTFKLSPGASGDVLVTVPARVNHPHDEDLSSKRNFNGTLIQRLMTGSIRHWRANLNQVQWKFPPSASAIDRTLKTALAHILINADLPAIQPGSRCYARSWIRDGASISSALLQMGHTTEVRDFIRWYATYQQADGRVPCCVDQRGADRVEENDSNGEFIYAVAEYYRYTRDQTFLRACWPQVQKAVSYLETLRSSRQTDRYQADDQIIFQGLLPESISHEGYASHPVHSYWDDLWALRGLKDAAYIAYSLGDIASESHYTQALEDMRHAVRSSMALVRQRRHIDYVPASADLGDFDPTSTAIAVDPVDELSVLQPEALKNTFDRYFKYVVRRKNGQTAEPAYTPYELRNVTSMIRLGQRARSLEALMYFMQGRRPAAWNQWAEVVWNDPRTPRFIGDMPHAWVGAEFIHAVRTLFAYERSDDRSLILAAGIPYSWLADGHRVGVKHLPTHYGTLDFHLQVTSPGVLQATISGNFQSLPRQVVLQIGLPAPLRHVRINGRPSVRFAAKSVTIDHLPAKVKLFYGH